ncbi:MAG: hypothetical protein A2252_09535 [Elusimicrobia bacterium RIFOXYA2_FULL_39_19]|nr:MAG: hypothetical protein A2252_09535 [Elusimicrobia bacterium RIFOXYA2_FULL_39_19]
MKKRYITVKELSEYTGFADQTIYRWISQRKIPFYKFGKSVKFDLAEIDKYVKKHRVPAVSEYLNNTKNNLS